MLDDDRVPVVALRHHKLNLAPASKQSSPNPLIKRQVVKFGEASADKLFLFFWNECGYLGFALDESTAVSAIDLHLSDD